MAKKEETKKVPAKVPGVNIPDGFEVVSDAQVDIEGWVKPDEEVPLMLAAEFVKTVYPKDRDTCFHIVRLNIPGKYVFNAEGEEVNAQPGQCVGIDHKAFMEPLLRMQPGQEILITWEGKKKLKSGNTPWNGRVAVPKGQRDRLEKKSTQRTQNTRGTGGGDIPF